MTRTIQIRDKIAVQCSQCTNFADTAYDCAAILLLRAALKITLL